MEYDNCVIENIVKAALSQNGYKMIKFETLQRKRYMGYDNRYSEDIDVVHKWISDVIGDNGLFCSFRCYAGKTLSRTRLISRVHIVFNQVFHTALGAHWIKLWKKHFTFVLVEEVKDCKRHAHLAIGIKSNKFTSKDIVKILAELEPRIKTTIYLKMKDKKIKLTKNRHQNNMVVSPIFDVGGVAEYISKEFTICFNEHGHFVNVDNLIFPDDVFPVKKKIVLSPEIKRTNERIIKQALGRRWEAKNRQKSRG